MGNCQTSLCLLVGTHCHIKGPFTQWHLITSDYVTRAYVELPSRVCSCEAWQLIRGAVERAACEARMSRRLAVVS